MDLGVRLLTSIWYALPDELLPGVPARFVRIETLLCMKEAAGRAKDLEDIRQLKLLQGSLGNEQ